MLQELKTESEPKQINKTKTLKDIRKESFDGGKKTWRYKNHIRTVRRLL